MRRILDIRPSPSVVISILALFVALSGVAVALPGENTVNSGDVVNNSLRSVDLKNGSGVKGVDVTDNSLSGADINESSLGSVPRAASLNGLRVLPVKHRSGDVTNQLIFSAGGLQLRVTCAFSNEELRATTTVTGGEIAVVSDDAIAADGSASLINHNLDNSFSPGEEFDLQDTPTASDDRIYQLHYIGGHGVSVTAQLITDGDLGANNCIVSGYAVDVP